MTKGVLVHPYRQTDALDYLCNTVLYPPPRVTPHSRSVYTVSTKKVEVGKGGKRGGVEQEVWVDWGGLNKKYGWTTSSDNAAQKPLGYLEATV